MGMIVILNLVNFIVVEYNFEAKKLSFIIFH